MNCTTRNAAFDEASPKHESHSGKSSSQNHVIIRVIFVRKRTLRFKEGNGLRDGWFFHLQRELILVAVRFHEPFRVQLRGTCSELSTEQLQHPLHPFLCIDHVRSCLRYIRNDAKLVVAR